MLPRAAARSLRGRSALIPAASPLQLRTYTKNNKPQKPNNYKPPPRAAPIPPRHGPDALKTPNQASTQGGPGAAAAASRSSDQSRKPDYSTLQDEFQGGVRKGGNSVLLSANASPKKADFKAAEKTTQPEYSTRQDEFQTSSPSSSNTTPQDTSPSAIDPAKAKTQQENVDSDPAEAPRQEEEVQIPLHDLTKGIPSTLDAELEAASSNKTHPNDLTSASSGGRGDRQMPASAYITSAERRRNRFYSWMFAGMFLFAFTGPIYLGRNWETDEEERKHADAPSGWGLGLFYNRMKARLADTLDYYNEPTFPKLLPNPDPTWERPYTLVLSLEDLLLHSEWTREHGWRMAKRPGVDYFLRYLSQYYELVIFTSVASMNADPVIRKLDPYRIIMWPLFREATRYKDGEYIKDLSYLNRPLNRVIMIDTVPGHVKLQPENAIILPKWTGDPNDKDLVSLIPFLEYTAAMGFEDTRTVLKSFEGKHIPTEFAAREAQARERFQAQLAADRAKKPRRSGVRLLGSALGIKAMPGAIDPMTGEAVSFSEGFDQGKMLQDQVRERGQKQYEILEREIRENGAKWLEEMKADEKKMNEEAMNGMKAGFMSWFGVGKKGEKKEGGK
ncbi:mitochondrial inner membrane protein required for protein import [Trapelia coarctata]|nr:mitochondrial inner membrane protein required for protein import [Trapelia coarctata]